VKITDFGIVHIEEATFTPTGALIGTPRYMSPEQVHGGRIDATLRHLRHRHHPLRIAHRLAAVHLRRHLLPAGQRPADFPAGNLPHHSRPPWTASS
jgi:serine/threonine protein kinase